MGCLILIAALGIGYAVAGFTGVAIVLLLLIVLQLAGS